MKGYPLSFRQEGTHLNKQQNEPTWQICWIQEFMLLSLQNGSQPVSRRNSIMGAFGVWHARSNGDFPKRSFLFIFTPALTSNLTISEKKIWNLNNFFNFHIFLSIWRQSPLPIPAFVSQNVKNKSYLVWCIKIEKYAFLVNLRPRLWVPWGQERLSYIKIFWQVSFRNMFAY